jgi:Na+-driven multidrug efflux pump
MNDPEMEKSETIVEVVEEKEDSPSRGALLTIASLANLFSWIAAAYYLVILGLTVYSIFAQGIQYFNVSNIPSIVSYILFGFVWFILLQAVARGLPVLAEIGDNVWFNSSDED